MATDDRRSVTGRSRPKVPFEQLNGTTFLRPQCRRCPARDRRRPLFARQRVGNPGEALGHVAHGWYWRLGAVALPDRTSPEGDRLLRKATPVIELLPLPCAQGEVGIAQVGREGGREAGRVSRSLGGGGCCVRPQH